MKKTLLLGSILLFIFLALFLFIPKSVLADGMGLTFDPYSDRWDYSGENNQQAFINYDNGLQKMIISVGLEEENSKSVVWLFPVPSEPSKVAIDVVKSLPQLSGEEISKKAKSNLDDTTKFLQMTQIYTIPFVLFSQTLSAGTTGFDNTLSASPQGIGKGIEPDVVVYEHLEKEGIASEIITARTASGLYDYLKNKGLKIENGSIPVLDNYIGKDYSFVASWINQPTQAVTEEYETIIKKVLKTNDELISDVPQDAVEMMINGVEKGLPGIREYFLKNPRDVKGYVATHAYAYSIVIEYLQKNRPDLAYKEITEKRLKPKPIQTNNNQKGIFVTFPTKDIYFPLLPTSVYGSKIVPATLRIIGHVSPKVFQDIKSYTKTEYYVDNYASFADDLKNFYSGQNQNIKYTKIEINAPSKFFTDDLWINNQAPVKTYYSTFVAKHPIASAIILFILSSILAGILAGLIIFRDLRKKPVKLGFIGLSNFLTLLGLLITTVLVGTKNKNESVEPLLAEIKQKGYFWKRRVATILFFVAAPFLIAGLFALPDFIDALPGLGRSLDIDDIIPILIIYILPITAIFAGFIVKRIKIDDNNLFEQLKSAEYSAWSFQPKDKMKYAFVPIFSILFLVVSWLLIELVKLTV